MRHQLNNLFNYLSLDRASFSEESLGFAKVLSPLPQSGEKREIWGHPKPRLGAGRP